MITINGQLATYEDMLALNVWICLGKIKIEYLKVGKDDKSYTNIITN